MWREFQCYKGSYKSQFLCHMGRVFTLYEEGVPVLHMQRVLTLQMYWCSLCHP